MTQTDSGPRGGTALSWGWLDQRVTTTFCRDTTCRCHKILLRVAQQYQANMAARGVMCQWVVFTFRIKAGLCARVHTPLVSRNQPRLQPPRPAI